jgi:hypothetical protein
LSVVGERAVLDKAAVDAGDEHRRGGKEFLAKLLRESGGWPANCHDQVQLVRSKRGPNALRGRGTGRLTAGARRLYRYLDELYGSRDSRIRLRTSASAKPDCGANGRSEDDNTNTCLVSPRATADSGPRNSNPTSNHR